MNNKSSIIASLLQAGLSNEGAQIYAALCKQTATHLTLSRITGINRTKVYRVVQELEQQGLVSRQTDDRGTFLRASDLGVWGLELSAREQRIREQLNTVHALAPALQQLRASVRADMTVRTYDGSDGLKQMCWHELKADEELLVLGGGSIEAMIPNKYWAEKHRRLSVEAGYNVLEIVNDMPDQTFTDNADFMKLYTCRILPANILTISNQTVIYNDTVAIYHWQNGQKTGIEIINTSYAAMMRHMFKMYWQMAAPLEANNTQT